MTERPRKCFILYLTFVLQNKDSSSLQVLTNGNRVICSIICGLQNPIINVTIMRIESELKEFDWVNLAQNYICSLIRRESLAFVDEGIFIWLFLLNFSSFWYAKNHLPFEKWKEKVRELNHICCNDGLSWVLGFSFPKR